MLDVPLWTCKCLVVHRKKKEEAPDDGSLATKGKTTSDRVRGRGRGRNRRVSIDDAIVVMGMLMDVVAIGAARDTEGDEEGRDDAHVDDPIAVDLGVSNFDELDQPSDKDSDGILDDVYVLGRV